MVSLLVLSKPQKQNNDCKYHNGCGHIHLLDGEYRRFSVPLKKGQGMIKAIFITLAVVVMIVIAFFTGWALKQLSDERDTATPPDGVDAGWPFSDDYTGI